MKFSLASFTPKNVLATSRLALIEFKLAIKSMSGKGWTNVRFETLNGKHLDYRVKHYGEFDLTNDKYYNNLVDQLDAHVWNQFNDMIDPETIEVYELEVE